MSFNKIFDLTAAGGVYFNFYNMYVTVTYLVHGTCACTLARLHACTLAQLQQHCSSLLFSQDFSHEDFSQRFFSKIFTVPHPLLPDPILRHPCLQRSPLSNYARLPPEQTIRHKNDTGPQACHMVHRNRNDTWKPKVPWIRVT